MRRISVAGLLGFVAVFAIGLAALVNATAVWTGVVFTLMVGLLLTSVLAAILRGWRRGGWLGFALFGWGFFLLGNISGLGLAPSTWLLPDLAAQWIFSTSNTEPLAPAIWHTYDSDGHARETPEYRDYLVATNLRNERSSNATLIGRWLSVLLLAEIGAILGVLLARGRRAGEVAPAAAPNIS
jgi:hypothetical protein